MSRRVLVAVSRAGRRGLALTLGLVIVSLSSLLFVTASQALHARAGSGGQDASAVKQPPPAARVRVEVVRTPRDGTSASAAWANLPLAVGATLTQYLGAGPEGTPDLCDAQAYKAPPSIRPSYLWQTDVRLLAVSAGGTTVELRWSRSRGEQVEAGDTRVLKIDAGQYHLVDYIAVTDRSSACANLALRLLAEPIPEDSGAPLTVDVWLLHQSAAGRRWVHQQMAGKSGTRMPFGLEALQWSADGRPLADSAQKESSVGLQVQGSVVAALRADGQLDVSVEATRTLSFGRVKLEGRGNQDFLSAAGETAALVLPAAAGRATSDAPPGLGPLAAGLSVAAGRATVDFARFFDRAKTSLYVLVAPQR